MAYSEEHLEDDLHEVIHTDPRLVMGTLTTRENIVLGSKPPLPTGKEPDLFVFDKRGTLTTIEFKRDWSPRSTVTQLFNYASSLARLDQASRLLRTVIRSSSFRQLECFIPEELFSYCITHPLE